VVWLLHSDNGMRQEKIRFVDVNSNVRTPRMRTDLVVFLSLLLILSAGLMVLVAPFFLSIFTGALLALLSYPAYDALRKTRLKSKMSALLVTLGVLVLVVAPISVFVFLTIKQAIAIGHGLGSDGTQTFRAFLDRVGQWGPIKTLIGEPEAVERQARVWIQSLGKGASATILSVVSNVPGLLLQAVLASIACFFLLLDGKRFVAWIRDRVPLSQDVRERVTLSFKNTAMSTVWATLAAAAAQAAVMLSAFLILGVPAASLAAGATFIFAWIPILGSTPVWLAGAGYLYLQDDIPKTVLMLGFGMIAGVVDNFVRPLVLKGRGNMHPLVSLVAIFGGVGMFGILGVFVGPILAAVVISLLEVWPEVGRRSGLMRS
jgi:predicted PurR-regulated permease PerM